MSLALGAASASYDGPLQLGAGGLAWPIRGAIVSQFAGTVIRAAETCYAHMSRFLTEKGAMLRQGEPLGLVGCTGRCFGDHLHFETWVGGRPVDPMGYL